MAFMMCMKRTFARQVLECAGPLALSSGRALRVGRCQPQSPRRQGTGALQHWSAAVCWLGVCLLAVKPVEAAEGFWKAGVARCNITPTEALWLAGYGNRDKPAEGSAMELWLKVLALEDEKGHRGVIVTSDTLGI